MAHEFILPEIDLYDVSQRVNLLKNEYENAEILVYGGTGFIGTWITECLIFANIELNLNLKVRVVTRNLKRAQNNFKKYDGKVLTFIEHDFSKSELDYTFPSDFIFHAATPTRISTGSSNSKEILETARNAAKHAASVKSNKFQIPKVLHLSSGAIYGAQSFSMKARLESDPPVISENAYVKSKLTIDSLFQTAYLEGKITYQSPRLFAFAGPLLQLDAHFAVGNFLRDGLAKQPIRINGNPQTTRSYMYPADLVSSLLTIVTYEKYENFNVGSDVPFSMLEIANLIAEITGNSKVVVSGKDLAPTNYVPSISNLRKIIPDFEFISLENSIIKWIDWIKS